MRRLYDLADAMEHRPRVLSVSIFAGFPLADLHDAGLSIYVATDGDQPLADALADELAATAWSLRHDFLHTALPVKDAVARARRLDGGPVVLADIADNTGGGAGGDTTEILRELLRVGARATTVACLWDPEVVRACAAAGPGATVTVTVGGKVDPVHGAPLTVTGRVRTLSDGRFVYKGPMMRGLETCVGPTAVLDHPDLAPAPVSRSRDDPLRRHRPGRREDPRREVVGPLPGRVRAARPCHPRGGRPRAVLVQPGAVHVRACAAADLPAGSDAGGLTMAAAAFNAGDFRVFDVKGFKPRMSEIRGRIRPKLEAIGHSLTPAVSRATGGPAFAHVAKHARRTVNPPGDTWVAFCADGRGYKKHTHFKVAVSRRCVRFLFEVGPEHADKKKWAGAWKRSAGKLGPVLRRVRLPVTPPSYAA